MSDNGNRKKGFKNKLGMTRRQFLKATAAAGAAGSLVNWFQNPPPVLAADTTATPTVCPFCSVGCGMMGVTDTSGSIIDIYGDPYHPFNEGAQCAKGASNFSLMNTEWRLGTGPLPNGHPLSAAGSAGPWWKDSSGAWNQYSSWEDAFDDITSALKYIVTTSAGNVPSAWLSEHFSQEPGADQVAFLGSSYMTNEECWLYRKLIALFGTNNTEHQARI